MTTLESLVSFLGPFATSFQFCTNVSGKITNIANVSGDIWRVTFSATLASSVGQFLYIDSGPNEGFHEITAVTSTTVDYVDTAGSVQTFGTGTLYNIKTRSLSDALAAETMHIEEMTGLPMSGAASISETHDGSGNEMCMLNRKPIVSLTSIQILSVPQTVFSIPVSSIYVENDTGILRIKSVNFDTYTYLTPIFPKGRKNILVTYLAGYDTPPADVARALVMLAGCYALSAEAGRTGGGTSLTVEGYSKTYGSRGKYSEFINYNSMQAYALLRKYVTGVVGN